MTDKQALKRWKFRHDFLEKWLAALLVKGHYYALDKAIVHIRARCEEEMKKAGFKYTFEKDDK